MKIEQTQTQIPQNPLEGNFNQWQWSPDVDVLNLGGDSQYSQVYVAGGTEIQTPKDSEGRFVALVGVPGEDSQDAFLAVVRGSDKEFYIVNGDPSAEPFHIPKGCKVDLGRRGITLEYLDGKQGVSKTFIPRSDLNRNCDILRDFGSQTSGSHVMFELDATDGLRITDLDSTNGTKVMVPKSEKVVRFGEA